MLPFALLCKGGSAVKVGEIVAKIIAKVALKSAKAAYATAACFAPYQPKEPANLKNIIKTK